MVENRPFLTFLTHAFLILGFAVVALPVYVAIIASTHDIATLMSGPVPLWPGSHLIENYSMILTSASAANGLPNYSHMALNSLIMAVVITIGKISISILSAFASIYFRMKRMVTVQDGVIQWQLVMAGSVLAMLPPILIVIFMQRLFIRGLTETEK